MVERLLRDGHEIVVYNIPPEAVRKAVEKGAIAASSLSNLATNLPGRKVVWLMVPSGEPVDQNIRELMPLLSAGDIIIDGGNSFWKDSQARAEMLRSKGIQFIDCGTSGGVWGLTEGYCLMYGGDKNASKYVEPIFKSLAPPEGYLYCGASGTGHFVKMVHNGIEYGMMQAYAEGFEILKKVPFNLDLPAISHLWQHGSVIRSWLLELAENALREDPDLEKLEAFVPDSGEGRWTVQAAIDLNVPAPVITHSLFARFQSRNKDSFAMKLLAALRNQFGGHAVKEK